MKVSIHRGKVIHGYVGSPRCMSYTVIGDKVNTASRLCGKADKDGVLISHEVWKNVYRQIEYEGKEPIEVKNKKYSLKVYRVIKMNV